MWNNRPRFSHTQIFLVPYLLGEVYIWGRDSVWGAAKSSPVLWGAEYNSKLILGMPHSINSLLVEWLRICFDFSRTFKKKSLPFNSFFILLSFFPDSHPFLKDPVLGSSEGTWLVKVALWERIRQWQLMGWQMVVEMLASLGWFLCKGLGSGNDFRDLLSAAIAMLLEGFLIWGKTKLFYGFLLCILIAATPSFSWPFLDAPSRLKYCSDAFFKRIHYLLPKECPASVLALDLHLQWLSTVSKTKEPSVASEFST